MRRRDFVALGGSGVAWPLAARAQQPAKIPHLGVLLYSTPQSDLQMEFVRNGLRDLGYVEGRNLVVTYRYAEGKPERLPELARELANLQPDVLLAIGGDVAPVMVKATQTIPIVFASSADPVQLGLVASLARPVGNATGVTFVRSAAMCSIRVSMPAVRWRRRHDPLRSTVCGNVLHERVRKLVHQRQPCACWSIAGAIVLRDPKRGGREGACVGVASPLR